MIIPVDYFEKEKDIKLTQSEIDKIIEELERAEYNVFKFMNYDKIIEKLKKIK